MANAMTLEEVRAKRAELRAARAAEQAANAEADEIRREIRALADDEAIVAAEKSIGKQGDRIYVVTNVDAPECDVVILKRANPVAFKRFSDLEAPQTKHIEELVSPCVVYPSADVFDRLVTTEKPALLLRCAKGVAYLAGARASEEQGKA